MTAPTPEAAREYLDAFVREALSCLKPGEEAGAWWEISECWRPIVEAHPGTSGYILIAPKPDEPAGWTDCLHGIVIQWVKGDQIKLVLPPAPNPYDRPAGAVDEDLTLADVPIAIAYERRSEVRCVVVMPRGIEDAPVAAILPRSPLLLPGGPRTAREAGRIFPQYFVRDLAAALRNDA
jgi:hypothetical protein